MEALNCERERLQQRLEGLKQIGFIDFLNRTDCLKLDNLIDDLEMVNPLSVCPYSLHERYRYKKSQVPLRRVGRLFSTDRR